MPALLAFNLGVEIGQLTLVGGFLPVAYGLKHTEWYRKWVVTAGSLLIAAVALVWLLERSIDFKLFSI